jgi:hypothetical protein
VWRLQRITASRRPRRYSSHFKISLDIRTFNFTDGGAGACLRSVTSNKRDDRTLDTMTNKFTATDFKKLCYDIETFSNRQWVVDKIFTDTYPNSFYYCTFKSSDLIFACNIHDTIFTLVDNKINQSTQYLNKGFVDNDSFKTAVDNALGEKNIEYNFLDSSFLNLKFYDKKDYETKITDFDKAKINLALKQLQLDLFDFKLYPGNVGSSLFHYLDD